MQKLYEDKIPNLQHAAGTISMPAGARLTIGGQQYITTSSVQVAGIFDIEIQRYQIYAIVVGGAVQLVISTNENSQGPSGYNAWKLVGSYYTNNLSPISFGSFINIEGSPTTTNFDFTPNWNLGTGQTLGTNIGRIKREEDRLKLEVYTQFTAVGTNAQNLLHDLPAGLQGTPLSQGAFEIGAIGTAGWRDDDNTEILAVRYKQLMPYWADNNGFYFAVDGSSSILLQNQVEANDRVNLEIEVKISGWSNIPIKDL